VQGRVEGSHGVVELAGRKQARGGFRGAFDRVLAFAAFGFNLRRGCLPLKISQSGVIWERRERRSERREGIGIPVRLDVGSRRFRGEFDCPLALATLGFRLRGKDFFLQGRDGWIAGLRIHHRHQRAECIIEPPGVDVRPCRGACGLNRAFALELREIGSRVTQSVFQGGRAWVLFASAAEQGDGGGGIARSQSIVGGCEGILNSPIPPLAFQCRLRRVEGTLEFRSVRNALRGFLDNLDRTRRIAGIERPAYRAERILNRAFPLLTHRCISRRRKRLLE
jgi:hypothetical protein